MPSLLNLNMFSIYIQLPIIPNYGNCIHQQNKDYVITKISALIIYHYEQAMSNVN